MMANTTAYENLLSDYSSKQQSVKDNVATYVNGVYSEWQAGEIDSTDLASADPQTIGTQASTEYNTTGYYGLSAAQLAALGLSGDNNASHVVETTWRYDVHNTTTDTLEEGTKNVNITGTLYYTGEDSQVFDTGVEYDPSNLNGVVYIAVSEMVDTSTGNETNFTGGFYTIEDNFTIHSATNTQTGDTINSTTMETRDYTSTNTTKLEEDINRLKEQRDFYEQQLTAASGGGSTGGSNNTFILVAVAMMAGAALMWRRDEN
jgi:hypothetical protein